MTKPAKQRSQNTNPDPAPPPINTGSSGSKLGLWTGLAVLFIPLIVYIHTLCPTVYVGDAGDFVTAAFTLGIPHPPGYPTYTILGHYFMQLPIPGGLSSPAYRMNMMSAVAAWSACVFMFLFLRRVLKNEWTAVLGALVLAFSRQFWEHAEIAEVYTMQVMFLTLILYLTVLYVQEKKTKWALMLAFIMGLAITHQYAVLIFYPGILIFIGVNGGLKLKWHTWALAILLAIIGLAPYAYLPLVKYKTPVGEVVFVKDKDEASLVPMDKVAVTDTPWVYFWDTFSRRQYSKSRVYTLSEEALPTRTTTPMVFRKYLQTADEDFSVPFLIFGGVGWLALLISVVKKRKDHELERSMIPYGAWLPPALGYIIYFLVTHFYPSGDILGAPLENLDVVVPPLLIPLEAVTAMIIALGFDATVRWIGAYVRSQGIADIAHSQKYRTFTGLLLIAGFMLVSANAWRNAKFCDKSQSVISYNYALNVLDSTDPNAILLTTGDETFLFWYVQNCEPSDDPNDPRPGYRKDVWATNWIQNLPVLEILQDEPNAMAIVTERFIRSSTYYQETLDLYGVPMILPHYGSRPINSTFVSESFAETDVIMLMDVVLRGLTYTFRRPGDVPDVGDPDVRARASLGAIKSGSAPMSVIDYFDSRPFRYYRMAGLPRFEELAPDLSNLDTSVYHSVNLEAQEREVLGRYQDALYRFGIQALLEDTDESANAAVAFLFQCVSLDPDDGFGWKELGDAFFARGSLESAAGAYEQLIDLAAVNPAIQPRQIAGAHAQLGHIALIHHDLETAEAQANIALARNPEEHIAQMILQEIERQRSQPTEEPPEEESPPEEEGGLHEFSPP